MLQPVDDDEPLRPRLSLVDRARTVPDAVVVTALTAVSTLLRLPGLGTWYWIDEGISVGIASHPLGDIPGLLTRDGSPPLYYLLLHVWMAVFGSSEVATHSLSLLFAVATVPAAWWAGRSLFDRRVGLVAAVLAAANPFVTLYSRETRMYTLVALLGVLVAGSFLHVFAFGRRRYLPLFVASLVLLLYTHTWGIFATAGCAAAVVPCLLARTDRRRLLADAALVALAANLGNLFDRAPGRAIKVGMVSFLVLAVATTGAVALTGVAVVVGAAAALFVDDMHERLMLGDAGANVLGGVLGCGVVLTCPPATRLAALLVVAFLNLASEVVSFSRVIDAVPPLRFLDHLGRRL